MNLDFFTQFRENALRFPERPAFRYLHPERPETYSYRHVASLVAAYGSALASNGLRPGDHAGIYLETHPLWGIAFLAAQSAGAVIVPLDPSHDPDYLAQLVSHSECKWLLTSPELMEKADSICAKLAFPPQCFLLTPTPAPGSQSPLPLVQRCLDDPLMILYTSGTTGSPKGALLTQRNVYRNVTAGIQIVRPTAEDHFLNVLPLCHVLALVINFIVPLYLGAQVSFLPGVDPERILAAFREQRITIFVCVPQFYYLLYRRIMQQVQQQPLWRRTLFHLLLTFSRISNDLLGLNPGRLFFPAIHRPFGPKLRLFGVGGARFDLDTARRLRDMGFRIVQAFGMTETAALATLALPKGRAVGTVGRPLPHVQIRIDSPAENGIGELLIRGENVMREYWKNPEATAEALRDGWLHTGDLAFIDRYGFLHITGRKKDVIILSSGKNVHPEPVEQFFLNSAPHIREICLVGLPGPEGERLHAVVVPDFERLRQEGIASVYDTVRWELETCSARLPPHQRPLSFEIWRHPLPRTATRKLKRFEVAQMVAASASRTPATQSTWMPRTEAERLVHQLVNRIKNVPRFEPSMHLELDLGLSSLERVELCSSLERTLGSSISQEQLVAAQTVSDLIHWAQKAQTEIRALAEASVIDWSRLLRAPLTTEEQRACACTLERSRWREFLWFLVGLPVRPLLRLLLRLRAEGVHHLPQPPFMLCPNHASFLDAFVLLTVLPRPLLKRIFFLGDVAIFGSPFMRRLARWSRVLIISQDHAVRSSMKVSAEGLRRGLILCVFPEGERSIDGKLKPFRLGPAILATELGVPVVPVGIRGTWEVWPRGSNRIRLRPVSVHFGPPLSPAGMSPEQFNSKLYQAVQQLL